ncbi:MAG: type II toxin-antitoxin system VapC family toxin [Deltaproteobacteria bacterium]|nr:type II toxin-antitoxin system VapC family toxin [Deltaproteobacteria bacterium]
MRFLVDTNILSELAKPSPDPGVLRWARTVHAIVLSAVTLEEVSFGLACKPVPRIQQWFSAFLQEHCEVVAVTEEVALHSGHLRGQLRARGRPRTQADMLIAATAAVHGLTLVTRNTRDFDGCGVPVLNPFSS